MAVRDYLESKLRVLEPLIAAEDMIEVAVNGDGRIWTERAGESHMALSDLHMTPTDARDLAGVIANRQQLSLTSDTPGISTTIEFAGATLRCQAIIPPASASGTVIAFRVFRRRPAEHSPKHFGFLRDQATSLEDERIAQLREIRCLAVENDDAVADGPVATVCSYVHGNHPA
ncbi:hypothetical protein [Pontibaca methylaminivorans]|uniref:Type II/IV secretion system protein n=1 Tax=Pontibaca methylaminivorans TaxID=515897 RepID=A0A1R3X8L9_9RHOB|nr:hypothetical protein [Pontibaca methylaminivorans]SIT87079.1 Type II/IV secretion system protein [Pontibaca methylaminivorans]